MKSEDITIAILIDCVNDYMKTFDVTVNGELEIINMLSRAREIFIRIDSILYARDHPEEALQRNLVAVTEPEKKDAPLPSPIVAYDKTDPLTLEDEETDPLTLEDEETEEDFDVQ